MSDQLPKGWRYAALTKLIGPSGFSCDGDWVESKDQDPSGEVRLIQLADIGEGYFRDKSRRYLTAEKARQLNCTFLKAGDLLISRLGEQLGKSCILPALDQPAVTVVDVHVLRTGTNEIDERWLMHLMNSHRVRSEFETESSGTTRKRITGKKVKCLRVPLAPEKEQRRIGSKIDELFSGIDAGEQALERVQKLVKRYRQSVLKAAVTGELTREWREQHAGELESGEALLNRILEARRKVWETAELARMTAKRQRPSDDRWKLKYKEPQSCSHKDLPELPSRWVWARAEQLCGPITKGTTPSSDEMTPDRGQVPFVKVYNLTFRTTLDFTMQPTFISKAVHEEKLGRSIVLPGDVLMNIVGPPLGKVSIVPETHPEWNINQAVAVFRPLPGLDRRFLALYLLSRAAQDWYSSKAKATVGQINLTLEICRDTPIPLPPLTEQIEIAQLIAVEDSRLDDLEVSLSKDQNYAIALRQSVLRSAFNGTLLSQNPADEPASVLLERIATQRTADALKESATKEHKSKRSFLAGQTNDKKTEKTAIARKGKAKA